MAMTHHAYSRILCCPRRQRGGVLVIAIFIISVMVAISARFTGDFQLSIARTEQQVYHAQLQQLLYSVESLTAWAVINDASTDKSNGQYNKEASYDHLQESWNTPLNTTVEDATVEATVSDALSYFNINQLSGRPQNYKADGTFAQRYTVAQRRFIRLLQTQPDALVDVTTAQHITEAVMDWIDSDNTPTGSGGAENNYYDAQEPPHRAANRLLVSITELRHVRGMSQEIYDYVEPLLIALPNNHGFNINTASIALMRSLNHEDIETPLSIDDGEVLIASRPQLVSDDAELVSDDTLEAYESIEAFFEGDEIARVFGNDEELWPSREGLRTGSDYFIVKAQAQHLDYRRQQISLIQRRPIDTGFETQVIRRSREQL